MRGGRTTLHALAVGCAVGLLAGSVRAEPPAIPEKDDKARAEALFQEGLKAFDEGSFDSACASLRESLRLDAKLGTLLNLALCHEKQGNVASAWMEYTHAAAWASQSGQSDRRDFANGHTILLERRLSRVQLELPALAELVVEIDRVPLAGPRRFLPVFLDPGDHALTVTAPGKRRFKSVIHVSPGPSAQDVTVPSLQDDVAVVAPPLPPAPDSGKTMRAIGLVVGAAGIAAFGIGTYFAAHTLTTLDGTDGSTAQGRAKSSTAASLAFFAGGAVAFGAGGFLLYSSRSRAPTPSSPPVAWLVRPLVGPFGGWLSLERAW